MEDQDKKVLGDQLVLGKSISYEDAKKVLEAMLKYCSETKPGRGMGLAVVDAAGIPVTIARMDGASPNNIRVAINKAYTAIDWRRNTKKTSMGSPCSPLLSTHPTQTGRLTLSGNYPCTFSSMKTVLSGKSNCGGSNQLLR